MKELLFNLKSELKVLALSIREAKKSRKSQPSGTGYVPGLADLQFKFRTRHVFRCLLRGKTLDQIESSRLVTPPNPTSSTEIMLHLSLSHLFNTLTDRNYEHKIQCRCLKCSEELRPRSYHEQALRSSAS